jgi:hypothetical protein
MTRLPDGTIMQSGLTHNPLNYGQERLNGLFVGIVLAVHYSDDPQNATAVTAADQRGSGPTCDVLITSSGNDNVWPVPNVLVLPEGPTGVDDFCESIPRACSGMIDGSQFQANMCLDYSKLDGDWCLVGFIGGSYAAPVMLKWWPHPGNRRDPATLGWPIQNPSTGAQDGGTLQQGRRMFRRFQGVKYTITNQGSVYFDTNEANSTLVGDKSGPTRQETDDGGDIQVDVKPARQMQVNFNKAVPLPKVPSLPQPNPPQGEYSRATDRTTVTLDKDTISLLAGKIIEMLTSDDYIDMHAKTKVRMRGDDASDTVILGDTDPANCDHTIKAETFRDMFFDTLVKAFNNHKHGTPVGPTSIPTPDPTPSGPVPAQTLGAAAITNFVKVKK